MKHPTLQPLQRQSVPTIARRFESFDESRNTRGVNIGDFGQIDDNVSCRWPPQHSQKLVPEGRRRANAKTPPQAHDRTLGALIHRDLKVGGTHYSVCQFISLLLSAASR